MAAIQIYFEGQTKEGRRARPKRGGVK